MNTNRLSSLIDELQKYKPSCKRQDLLLKAVGERLSTSLDTYNHELQLSLSYLERSDAFKVLKRINRL